MVGFQNTRLHIADNKFFVKPHPRQLWVEGSPVFDHTMLYHSENNFDGSKHSKRLGFCNQESNCLETDLQVEKSN